jgi:hypothetical protein
MGVEQQLGWRNPTVLASVRSECTSTQRRTVLRSPLQAWIVFVRRCCIGSDWRSCSYPLRPLANSRRSVSNAAGRIREVLDAAFE